MGSAENVQASSAAARVARQAAGWTLLLVGGGLLVLPGPGIPLVLGGLALLSRDHRWARRAQARLGARWRAVRGRLRRDPGRLPG